MTTYNLNQTPTEDKIVAKAVERLAAVITHGGSEKLSGIAEEMVRAGEAIFADARAGLEHSSVKPTQQ